MGKEDLNGKRNEIQTDLRHSRLKAQVLLEYFDNPSGEKDTPDFICYSAWADGVYLIISELITAAEVMESFMDEHMAVRRLGDEKIRNSPEVTQS